MPGSTSQVGKPVFTLDGRVLADFADGDYITADMPEDISAMKVSKNGNTIVVLKESGRMVAIKVRLLKASSDDKFINSRAQEWKSDAPAFIPFAGTYAERVGDGAGNVNTVVYQLAGGYPKRIPAASMSSEGEAKSAVAEWEIHFANGDRSIQ
jgi:hypothetical protein